jgi:hypothetical protein
MELKGANYSGLRSRDWLLIPVRRAEEIQSFLRNYETPMDLRMGAGVLDLNSTNWCQHQQTVKLMVKGDELLG